jgi:type IV secretory pathway VirB10-like protein
MHTAGNRFAALTGATLSVALALFVAVASAGAFNGASTANTPLLSLAQESPTPEPTPEPTSEPTPEPTAEPTPEPTPEATPAPTEEPTEEPTATPTEEPTEEASPTATPEPAGTEDSDDDTIWIALIVVGLLGIAGVLLYLWLSRRGTRVESEAQWNKRLKADAGEARWINDVLAADIANRATSRTADELGRQWQEGRRRIDDLDAELFRLLSTAPTELAVTQTRNLTEALRALREALDTDVRLRAGEPQPGQDVLLEDSAGTISGRRHLLAGAIAAIENPDAQPPAGPPPAGA